MAPHVSHRSLAHPHGFYYSFKAFLALNLECREARDLVYALFGVSTELQNSGMVPDYTRPLAEVLVDGLKACIEDVTRLYDANANFKFLWRILRRVDGLVSYVELVASIKGRLESLDAGISFKYGTIAQYLQAALEELELGENASLCHCQHASP